jgi:hypothetical protein
MLSSSEIDQLFEGTTFGMEFDSGSFDRHRSLPVPHKWCTDEVCAHSNFGVGNDPKLEFSMFGGEIQFAPQNSESDLLREVTSVVNNLMPDDQHRHIGTIHVHVRIPNLLSRLDLLKHLVLWFNDWNVEIIEHVWKWDFADNSHLPIGARRYYKWLEDCHIKAKNQVYDDAALQRMNVMPCSSAAELALILHNSPKDWKNEWTDLGVTRKVRRPNVNFGHLAINETIEFRSFMATTDETLLKNIIEHPLKMMRMALLDDPDPLRVCRGLEFQDNFSTLFDDDTPAKLILASETTGYFNPRLSIHRALHRRLMSEDLTLRELNYPQYWIDKGFSQ